MKNILQLRSLKNESEEQNIRKSQGEVEWLKFEMEKAIKKKRVDFPLHFFLLLEEAYSLCYRSPLRNCSELRCSQGEILSLYYS